MNTLLTALSKLYFHFTLRVSGSSTDEMMSSVAHHYYLLHLIALCAKRI